MRNFMKGIGNVLTSCVKDFLRKVIEPVIRIITSLYYEQSDVDIARHFYELGLNAKNSQN